MDNSEVEILLVEDNMADVEMTMRILKKANLANRLLHLKDGAEATDFLFGHGKFSNRELTNTPKVILLDIKMPRVDGIEVLRQIRSNEATRLIPVIVMASSKEEMELIKSYSLGADSYLMKPVSFENFAKAISELGLYWSLTNRTTNILDNG